jgi:hypothetical protein
VLSDWRCSRNTQIRGTRERGDRFKEKNNRRVRGEMAPATKTSDGSINETMTALVGALVTVVIIGRNGTNRLISRVSALLRSDRGDVPGWVLVTVMTAGLVTGLWMVADDQLTTLLSKAINSVSN